MPTEKILDFLPGLKSYILGAAMILLGLAEAIDAVLGGGVFGAALTEAIQTILEGAAVMTLRRGIKTDAVAQRLTRHPTTTRGSRA